MKHEAFQVNGENIELFASQHFCALKSKGDPNFYFTLAHVVENFRQRNRRLSLEFSQMTLKLHRTLSKLMMTMHPHQKTLL
jgi:hypothetical protein